MNHGRSGFVSYPSPGTSVDPVQYTNQQRSGRSDSATQQQTVSTGNGSQLRPVDTSNVQRQSTKLAPVMNVNMTQKTIATQAHVENGGTSHLEQKDCTLTASAEASSNGQQQPAARQPSGPAAKVTQNFSGTINAQEFNAFVEKGQGDS